MKKVITTEQRPIKLWLNNIEEGALLQLKNLANLPFLYKWVCAMPDCHLGYGMPIGGVIATKNVIIPNAVGVDIGCGMCAVKTSLKVIDIQSNIKTIMGEIRKVIPVGFNHNEKEQDNSLMPEIDSRRDMKIVGNQYSSALKQIGTLGGGNHFIEIQKDEENNIWIMIHSGSRNLGYKVAEYYNNIAKKLNKKWYSSVPVNYDLAFLPIESQEAKDYIKEMNYCVEFALANRRLMMKKIMNVFYNVLKMKDPVNPLFEPMINIAHNYAQFESHFNENVIIHRKGATLARKDTIGIIPGSQGTHSYIVKGLGNSESFNSCSHGAGRRLGRNQARRELKLKEQQEKLNKKGIIHSIRNEKDLDEAPDAYKNIEIVMENQSDLVEIITELTPLAVIKG